MTPMNRTTPTNPATLENRTTPMNQTLQIATATIPTVARMRTARAPWWDSWTTP
jgi:hypothetical protein